MTWLLLLIISVLSWTELAQAVTLPTLPTANVDTTMPTVTGNTYNATCATLQAQLNAAAAASVTLTHQVILATGTTCTGQYNLPSHTGGTGWILIKGPNYASLPASGTRVSLTDAALMPQIQRPNSGGAVAINASNGAQRYRFIGIDLINAVGTTGNQIVVLGPPHVTGSNTGYFIFDRVLLRDTRAAGSANTRRGINANAEAGTVALIDSYCAHVGEQGADAQCFQTDENPGPLLVQNNFLEAAGENTMLCGGIDPDNVGLMPKNATFRLNLFQVNPAWYNFQGYPVKTLFELKCGNKVLVEANTFENMPVDGSGYAFRLTPRNIYGGGTFSEASDLTVRYNLIRNVSSWINSFGSEDGQGLGYQSMHSKRWHFHNNLVYGLNFLGGSQHGIMIISTTGGGQSSCTDPSPSCQNEDIIFDHNTVDNVAYQLWYNTFGAKTGLVFTNNLINSNNSYGFFSQSSGNQWGTAALNTDWGTNLWTWTNNSIAGLGGLGATQASYPQGNSNSYPSSYTSFLWVSPCTSGAPCGGVDYTLQATSPAKGTASDGTDRGVNFAAYTAARAGTSLPADSTPPAVPAGLAVVAP